ncbi:MAG TPA: hypothetical protein VLA04_04035 [Verrucomicrobiae bacterium]|nr:hypothetical protein [Verrucomicrobiae bacterium]
MIVSLKTRLIAVLAVLGIFASFASAQEDIDVQESARANSRLNKSQSGARPSDLRSALAAGIYFMTWLPPSTTLTYDFDGYYEQETVPSELARIFKEEIASAATKIKLPHHKGTTAARLEALAAFGLPADLVLVTDDSRVADPGLIGTVNFQLTLDTGARGGTISGRGVQIGLGDSKVVLKLSGSVDCFGWDRISVASSTPKERTVPMTLGKDVELEVNDERNILRFLNVGSVGGSYSERSRPSIPGNIRKIIREMANEIVADLAAQLK